MAQDHLDLECDYANSTLEVGLTCENYLNYAQGAACAIEHPDGDDNMEEYCTSKDMLSQTLDEQIETMKDDDITIDDGSNAH